VEVEVNPAAGKLPDPTILVDVRRLLDAYYDRRPDPSEPEQRVAFGTSGHRGTSMDATFNEEHVVAMTEAICRYRASQGIDGPLFLGRDTHALSEPAFRTTLEVLAGHGVDVWLDAAYGYTPTPVISHQILTHNRGSRDRRADGIVLTPSHNPPEDGGFKYNPPHGGPAGTEVTGWIEDRANDVLEAGPNGVRRVPFERAIRAPTSHRCDYVSEYVDAVSAVIDLEVVREAGLKLGVDPLGGSSVAFWREIATRHRLDITIVNDAVDPTFRFVPVDHDGRIRMDCSSPYAMARLTDLRERFDVAFANDPDADRHGVVTPGVGLLNPNHHLAACVAYLFGGGREWAPNVGVGKTVVTSSIIDRVAADSNRRLVEVPVGFKWFVAGLSDGSLGFGGEESAGASFLRRDGSVWTTDKDGIAPCLLAAEITARSGEDPGKLYRRLSERLGAPEYRRIDVAAAPAEKAALSRLSAEDVAVRELAGEPICDLLTTAPGNGVPIGGLKAVAEHGWFAARPSGTEDVYKIYAESYLGTQHLERIIDEARRIVGSALAHAGTGSAL
jgi:phosphoglucomutase